MLTNRSLSEATGFDVRLKAELFQRGGSYKLRGPLNKIARLSDEERARGVICSSAGNHSQGVALAARQYGVRAVVVMAENATPSKIAATEGYGARVVLHGSIWDEANEKALELVESEGLTYIHPFGRPGADRGAGDPRARDHGAVPRSRTAGRPHRRRRSHFGRLDGGGSPSIQPSGSWGSNLPGLRR